MDADDNSLSISPEDIQRLTPADQQSLQQFIAAENQKATVQRSSSHVPYLSILYRSPTNSYFLHSDPRIHRDVLQEMYQRLHLERAVDDERRHVYAELRESVYG